MSAGAVLRADTAAQAFTTALNTGALIQTPNVGAGSAITEWNGVRIQSAPTAGTKYAIRTMDTSPLNLGGSIWQPASSGTQTVPNATGNVVLDSATQTLTNKTIDTAGSNTIKINGNTLSAAAGTATVTLPAATDTLVGRATTDTLTNKNLISPQLNGITISEAPVMTWSTFIPGNLTIITGVSQITIPKGITILRFESITYANAPSGCITNAVLNIADITNASTLTTLTQSAQVSDSGALSINVPAGHVLRVGVSTTASGCTTTPQNAVVEVQYRMQ